jgi:hypothetical protein
MTERRQTRVTVRTSPHWQTRLVAGLLFSLAPSACTQQKPVEAPNAVLSLAAVPAAPSLSADPAPASINSARAMQYVKEIVAFGPRPIGSPNHKKVEDYIYSHLKGDLV